MANPKSKLQIVTESIMEIVSATAIISAIFFAAIALYFYRQARMAQAELDQQKYELGEANTKIALVEQEISAKTLQMQDWEKVKEESMRAAKAAMFESGTEIFKKEAKQLGEHFTKVTETVAVLHSKVKHHENKVEAVWKTLTSPGEGGRFSEIGLENTLKNYGLENGRDFIMQFTTKDGETGSTLRPDAVIFLPAGNILVLDSKASKFFVELSSSDVANEKEIEGKLIRRMREHINVLASRGYRDAVENAYRKSSRDDKIRNIYTVMYVQSEAQLEKLYQLDNEFRQRTEKAGIIPSGPTGLAGLLSIAKMEISQEKRWSESENIINELKALLGGLETVIGYAAGVGKSIANAARSYQKFTSSMNRNLLPKARKISAMGVELPKSKSIPGNMQSFSISSDENIIDGSAESVEEKQRQLEDA